MSPIAYDSITVGMSVNAVREKLGQPSRIVQSRKDEAEAWTYLSPTSTLREGMQVGGVTCYFKEVR